MTGASVGGAAAVAPPWVGWPGLDEPTLQRHAASAHLPVLLITTAQLVGDPTVLRPEWRPQFAEDGTLVPLDPHDDASARLTCARRLSAWARRGVAVPGSADARFVAAVLNWLGLDPDAGHVAMIAEEITPEGVDLKAPRWHKDEVAPERELRVVVIGAGISGLAAAHRLREAGVPVTVLEKNEDVGGTWFENSYPGCRVDVPSELYGYSFARRSDWDFHFSQQVVWLDYLRGVAEATGVADCIRFGTEVLSAEWQEDRAGWLLTVRDAEGVGTVFGHVLVPAVGQLNRPALPDIPGRDTFVGPAFHSGQWRSDVGLAGRTIGVIGTGASAFQFVPEIAREAGRVILYQRTPAWLLPTPNYHARVGESMRWLHDRLPLHSTWYRMWLLSLEPAMLDLPGKCTVDPTYPPTERAVSVSNDRLRELLTAHIDAQLGDDADLRRRILPGYPVGAKRMLRDDGQWIRTLQREDVELVTDPIAEITDCGVRTRDGRERPCDVLIYGTGFAAQDFLAPMRIQGRNGRHLRNWWAGDARAYLGMSVPGFPNFFALYGPNTNLVVQGGSISYLAECQAGYVIDAVRQLLIRNAVSMDVRERTYREFNDEIDAANAQRVWGWSGVNSWYKNALGRVSQSWPYLTLDYWQRTRQVACDDFDWDT